MLNTAPPQISLPNPLIKNRGHSFAFHDVKLTEPNQWFADKFPDQTLAFGSAFLHAKRNSLDSDICIPLFPNDDFFAAAIGGAKNFGHQVVYLPSEDVFYFYDYHPDAFCFVSEAKLKILLSNYMIRCAQDSRAYVHVQNLVVAFRKDEVLDRIITKAKAILEVEHGFFHGKNGNRRLIDGKYIEPNAEPSYQLFVKRAIVREADAKLTVGDAFHRYYQFCKDNAMKPLTRSEFKGLVAEVIREQYNLGLRHDIISETGKQTHGWDGLACPLEPVTGLN